MVVIIGSDLIVFKNISYTFKFFNFFKNQLILLNRKSSYLNIRFYGKLPQNWKKWEIRNRRSSIIDKKMTENIDIAKIITPLRISVKEQGEYVRKLKEENASEIEIEKAVNKLLEKKKILEDKELEFLPNDNTIEKTRLEDLLKRRFYVTSSFEIYGGYAGLYDLGPIGCPIKQNIINIWRNHFIIEEDLFEVDCTIVTPEPVLKASGHLERFSDYMVRDIINGNCFRLDHLIKNHLNDLKKNTNDINLKLKYETLINNLDNLNAKELNDLKEKFEIKSPITNNNLSDPIEFNLMFNTLIGPTGLCKGYLRPETSQGIFVNFKRLLEFNQGKLPFGVAQIGKAFRNEISPRSGLLRLREFYLAEIEYFFKSDQKHHSKFEGIKDLKLNLFTACNQIEGKSFVKMSIEEAIKNKVFNNEILGYYIGRIYLFLTKIGINSEKLRFRQHMTNEMAHYASDCWDAECLLSYGWTEIVGCADRSCFDLNQHTNASNTKLVAESLLQVPKKVKVVKCIPQNSILGKLFRKDSQFIIEKLNNLSEKEIKDLQETIQKTGSAVLEGTNNAKFEVNEQHFKIDSLEKTVHVEEFTPNVIEPSFGISRIIYSVLEHNFKQRDDELRTFFSLPPEVAPIKCSILPLINNDKFNPFIKKIKNDLVGYNLACRVEDSRGSIGKRYSRTDELSIPFNITVDFDTLNEPHSVTLRERDTTDQLRIPLEDVCLHVFNLSCGKEKWFELKEKYPLFNSKNE